MNFCPLCFKMLLVQSSTSGNRLVCFQCRYFYPLTKSQKKVINYNTQTSKDVEVIDQDQQVTSLPQTQTLCPKCNHNKAYFQQRQTRSADQAQTIFYTCVMCRYKWAQN